MKTYENLLLGGLKAKTGKRSRTSKSHTTPTDFQDGVNDFDVGVNDSIPESIANVAMSLMICNIHHRSHNISNGPPLEQSYRMVPIFQPIFGGTLRNEIIL